MRERYAATRAAGRDPDPGGGAAGALLHALVLAKAAGDGAACARLRALAADPAALWAALAAPPARAGRRRGGGTGGPG